MRDDEFDCDGCDECEIAPGAVWVTSSSSRLHWTDLFIALADVLTGIGETVGEFGDTIGDALRSHANYVASRRAFSARVLEDIETL